MGFRELPDDLPVPEDDGTAEHLWGRALPATHFPATTGGFIDISDRGPGPLVVYIYPRTGGPGIDLPPDWDSIPGARGCTPQACGFRDHHGELQAMGAEVVGVSAQSPVEQAEFAAREHLPFPLASDTAFVLEESLGVPTFEAGGRRLYRRLTLIARAGVVEHVMYPVFPPDENAAAVVAYLASGESF